MIAAAPSAKAQEQAITGHHTWARQFLRRAAHDRPVRIHQFQSDPLQGVVHLGRLRLDAAHNRPALDLLASGRGHGKVLIGLTIPLERLMDAYEAAAAISASYFAR